MRRGFVRPLSIITPINRARRKSTAWSASRSFCAASLAGASRSWIVPESALLRPVLVSSVEDLISVPLEKLDQCRPAEYFPRRQSAASWVLGARAPIGFELCSLAFGRSPQSMRALIEALVS